MRGEEARRQDLDLMVELAGQMGDARDLRALAARLARHLSDREQDLLGDAVRWLRLRPLILAALAERAWRVDELEGRPGRAGGAHFR